MKYVALLRGINVGGNSIIKMVDLKECFEKCGFKNVSTFIQSGNVIFESEMTNVQEITKKLEENLLKTFDIPIRVIVLSSTQLQKVLSGVPDEWNKDDLRCYIAFVKSPVTSKDVLKEVQLNKDVDFIKTGQGVLYMSTKLSGLTQSGFSKLSRKKIYQDITIRNYTTTQKIFNLMKK